MTSYIFTTPVVEEGPIGRHRLFYFYKLNRGVSVYKKDGAYATVRWATQDMIDNYDAFYLGGHKHEVTEAIKTELINGGIGVTEANFTAI